MPAQLRAEHLVLVFQRRVPITATPSPKRLLGATQPFSGCPAFDHPEPLARFRPVVGQSEKVECAVPTVGSLVGLRFPERNERRLRRMNGEPEASKPLRQHGHNLASVPLLFAADDKVIGKANQEASALHPWPYLTFKPGIEDMMEEDICQHGGNLSPYKVANFFFRDRYHSD